MMMTGRVRAGFNGSPATPIVVWLTVLILYLLTAPVAAEAQQPGKIYRIGYLQTSTRQEQLHMVKAFEDGLRDLGYRVGQNVVIEYRFADARPERLPELAADLVRLNVDVIVTGINSNTAAAMKATTTIPIVMANSVDPIGAGFAETLARPGRNVTGVTQDTGNEMFGKRLELLLEIVRRGSREWAVLWNPHFWAEPGPLEGHSGRRPEVGAYASVCGDARTRRPRTGFCLDHEDAPGWACRDGGCGLVYVSRPDCEHGHQESAAGDCSGERIR
jgi:hypothetical protein